MLNKRLLKPTAGAARASSFYAVACLFIAVVTWLPQDAEAKSCKKGIPCGNTCISAQKVCRLEGPLPSATKVPPQVSARPVEIKAEAKGDEKPAETFSAFDEEPAAPAESATTTPVKFSGSSARLHPESYYRDQLCEPKWHGIANYTLSDGVAADCVTMKLAVRFAYADAAKDAMADALHYGRTSGLTPTVAVIVEREKDLLFVPELTELKKTYKLPTRILVIRDQ